MLRAGRARRRTGSSPGSTSRSPSTSTGRRSVAATRSPRPPARPDELTITVKRVPGGRCRTGCTTTCGRATRSRSTGPSAASAPRTAPGARVPLPLRRQRHHAADVDGCARSIDAGEPVDVVFVHHARTPADIVFRDELRVIEAEHPGVRVVVVCEDDAPDERWTGPRGRVTSADAARSRSRPRRTGRSSPAVRRPTWRRSGGCSPAPAPTRTRCHEESLRPRPRGAAPGVGSRHGGGAVHAWSCGAAGAPSRADRADDPAGRRRGTRRQLALVVPGGDVRHLQDRTAVGHGRHEPRRRHPAPRDRARPDPALLLHPHATTSSSTPEGRRTVRPRVRYAGGVRPRRPPGAAAG